MDEERPGSTGDLGQGRSPADRYQATRRALKISFDSDLRANYYPGTAMRTLTPPRTCLIAPQTAAHMGVWIVLAVLCAPGAGAKSIPRPHRQPRQVVRIIERLEEQWRQAELDANTTVMANMLSDDYLGIYSDGTLATKAETLAGFKSGAIHFTKMDTSDRKIRVFGTTAVVVSTAEVAGTNHGDQISGRYRYTRVYHRRNSVWKIVSFEASTLHEHRHSH